MTWYDFRRQRKQQEREAVMLAANLINRALNPDLWEPREIPAVWNRSDLTDGDAERDEGKR